MITKPRIPLAERFWSFVSRSETCWSWTGRKTWSGYGELCAGGKHSKKLRAHRVSWELAFGGVPGGLCVLHRCDNRLCVRPDHLFLGTRRDNSEDRCLKGRTARGEEVGGARLSAEQVRVIRRLVSEGLTQRTVAQNYGVTRSTVGHICSGKRWRHLGESA